MSSPGLKVCAPAKINLSLRVTGKRVDGYHLLDSLVAFADFGDEISIAPAREFAFRIAGPFADQFSPEESAADPDSKNLAVRAALGMARLLDRAPDVEIALEKKLPLGGGIGGGSADAAALMRGLLDYWEISGTPPGLVDLAASLGADVPVCLAGKPARMRGIGERLDVLNSFPSISAVLVHPGTPCPTAEVFHRFRQPFSAELPISDRFDTLDDLLAFLKENGNDLTKPACEAVPEIRDVLDALAERESCVLSRMSGSGSACFGLFPSREEAVAAAAKIQAENPLWWVRACRIMGAAEVAPPEATAPDRPTR